MEYKSNDSISFCYDNKSFRANQAKIMFCFYNTFSPIVHRFYFLIGFCIEYRQNNLHFM